MAPTKEPVAVRGECRRGHEIITVAPKGKLTWRGPCPHEEDGKVCGEKVVAHRDTAARQAARTKAAEDKATAAAAKAAAEEPPSPPAKKPRQLRKVEKYRDPAPGFDDRPAGGDPGVEPPAPGAGGPPPGGDDDGGEHELGEFAEATRGRRWKERWAARKARVPQYEDHAGWSAPGILP